MYTVNYLEIALPEPNQYPIDSTRHISQAREERLPTLED